MISKTHQFHPINKTRNIFNKIKSTNIRLLMRMMLIIGKKLASLYNLQTKTECVGFITQTYKTKHNADDVISFVRSQKSWHKYIVSKRFSGLEIFPNN